MNPSDLVAAPRIVVVDDDPAVCAALQFSFELDGFEVETYASAEALAGRPDFPANTCLVLDYQLPGANGLQLLGALRDRRITSPAVLITTNPTRRLRAEARAAGVEIVEKPLLSEALERNVRRALQLA